MDSPSPIFISYSHKDSKWLTILQTYLKPFLRELEIIPWDDTQIRPSAEWRVDLKKAISGAWVAVLLVSQDFLASDFIYKHELPPILNAARSRGLKIFWIAVRPSSYLNTELEMFQALGDPKTPLSTLEKAAREGALVEMCGQIAKACEETIAAGAGRPARTDPVAVEASSHSARQGFEALVEIMRRDSSVQESVGAFRAVFGASLRQIEILVYYKNLHDNLHTLQFKCYDYLKNIVRTAKAHPDEMSIWDNVIEYELMLQDIVRGLQRAAQPQTTAFAAPPWVPNLIADLRTLFEAVKSNDPEQISNSIGPLRKVLAIQPSRLNDRLVEAARALPLPALVRALAGVCGGLDTARVNPDMLTRFQDGVTALNELNASLTSLTDSHSRWQEIDQEIRLVEGTVAQGFDDLKLSWPELKRMTEAHCRDGGQQCSRPVSQAPGGEAPGAAPEWPRLLSEEMRKLEEALTAEDSFKVRQHFQRYRRRVNDQFYQVDLELKELCEKLSRVSTPLAQVWEMIR